MTISSLLVRSLILAVGLGFCSHSAAQEGAEFTFYDDPFVLGSYIDDPSTLIKKGMKQYEWQSVEEVPGVVRAKLDYKGYELRVDIHYSATKIWFEPISAINNDCAKKPCEVVQRHVDRWRLGLRRGIAKAITDEAIKDAYNDVYSQP